jgi:hypothetical protein
MSNAIVTCIWDIKRDTLIDSRSRTFEHYLKHFVSKINVFIKFCKN